MEARSLQLHTVPKMARNIIVFSPDVLPYPGFPTTGSALRAWGLGHALAAAGHQVQFSMPRFLLGKYPGVVTEAMYENAWTLATAKGIVQRSGADLVVACGWSSAMYAFVEGRSPGVPLLLDQHGPHLLERHFQGYGTDKHNRIEKIRALARADFFSCAGDIQLDYFRPLLRQAGWKDRDRQERSVAIPLSLSPDLPRRTSPQAPLFVYGGVFLPWQDPSLSLTTLVEVLERRGRGKLLFFGGKHCSYDVPGGLFEQLAAELAKSSAVKMMGMVSHDELIAHYTRASVAIDLMARNPERELAFTTRTVEYLWCGLPVIYNNYSELSRYIGDYQAGWIVDPQDKRQIIATIEAVLDDPAEVARRSANAQRLVRERLAWDRTIAPLDRFAEMATMRAKSKWDGGSPTAATIRYWEKVKYHYRISGLRGVCQKAATVLFNRDYRRRRAS